MKLSYMLKECRQKSGLTQYQLSDKLHVSRKTISNWEHNRSEPGLDMLTQLSDMYNISIDNLLKGEIKENNKELIISYYFEIILLFFSYLDVFGIRTHIIPAFLLINSCFLTVKFNNWDVIFYRKKQIVKALIISMMFCIITISIYVISRNLLPIIYNYSSLSSYWYWYIFWFGVFMILITYSFLLCLLLSREFW